MAPISGTAWQSIAPVGPRVTYFVDRRLMSNADSVISTNQKDASYKYYDQSGSDWSHGWGPMEGMLFGQADLTQFGAYYQDVPVNIEFREDDDGGENCNYNMLSPPGGVVAAGVALGW